MCRPVRNPCRQAVVQQFSAAALFVSPMLSVTGRRSGESGTSGAVGPVPNSMFMAFAFYNTQTEGLRATSTRKYHHVPSPLLIGAFGAIPLVDNLFSTSMFPGNSMVTYCYFYYTSHISRIIHLSAGFRILRTFNSFFLNLHSRWDCKCT